MLLSRQCSQLRSHFPAGINDICAQSKGQFKHSLKYIMESSSGDSRRDDEPVQEEGQGDEDRNENNNDIGDDDHRQQISVTQVGHRNTCTLQIGQGRQVNVNITYNILPSPTESTGASFDFQGRSRFKIHVPNINVDEAAFSEVQQDQSASEDHLRRLLFNLLEVRRGCVELVTEHISPEAITHLIQAIKDGKVDQLVLDILKKDSVSRHIDKDSLDVSVSIYIPPELHSLLNVTSSGSRPDVLWPTTTSDSGDQPNSRDDLSMDSPSDSLTTSITPPRLREEDVGLQFLLRHIHRRFPRDRLDELHTCCQKVLGSQYNMEGQLVTSTLDFLHQLSQQGHVTRNNVTLLWTLMIKLNYPNLLEALLDYEESVETQVRDWLDIHEVWTNYGYITCCLSPYHKTMSERLVQKFLTTVQEATGTVPSHALVRWRTVDGPLSITMVIVRKVQEHGSKTDLKEELKKLGVDTIDIGADASKLKTRPDVHFQHQKRWWIPKSQSDVNKSHKKWKSTRRVFKSKLQSYTSQLTRPLNVMLLGLCGVGKSSCINSLVAAVTGDGFREVSQAGWHGGIVEPVTMSTQRYVNCGVTEPSSIFPTLFDTMGFPDESTGHLKAVTKLYVDGYINTEVPTSRLVEFAKDHGWHSLQRKFNTYHPEYDVDRIIYVISARSPLPVNHMTVIRESAAGRPIFLIITKTDIVEDLDIESLRTRARDVIGVDEDHMFTMINYSDDTTPNRTTRMYPDLDEANIKILMKICQPDGDWDKKKKDRVEEALLSETQSSRSDTLREPVTRPSVVKSNSPQSGLQQGLLRGTLGLFAFLAAIVAVFWHLSIFRRQFAL